jgi:hypothetical protein
MKLYHWVLSVQRHTGDVMNSRTFFGTVEPWDGATRADMFAQVLQEHYRLYPEIAGGTVLFFSLEPDQL